MNSFIFTDFDSLSLCIGGKPYTVDSTNPNWEAIIAALKAEDFNVIPGLINRASVIKTYVESAGSYNNIVVNADYGTIMYFNEPVNSVIVDHIFRMKDEGFNINPMLRFLDNLLSNPSKRAVDELYGFLQYGKMPVTEDGCFLAYKRVRADYKSVHDGKTDNSIGSTVAMPRNQVNENSHETCSTGLHFCSFEYLKSFSGAKIVILKVNPRDVVSIPNDYNNTKGRACQYDVIGELSEEEFNRALQGNIFKEAVRSSTGEKVAPKAKTVAEAYVEGLQAKGAKVGPADSPFYLGYDAGYNDAGAGDDYDDCNHEYGYYSAEEKAYEEGYAKGYDDSEEGANRRYILADQAAKFEQKAPEAAQPAPVAKAGPKVSKSDFCRGYRDGYNNAEEGDGYQCGEGGNYEEGYDKGYDAYCDGFDRAYDFDDTPTSNLARSAAEVKAQYDAGYGDGRNLRTAKNPRDDAYMLGYKDGKGHKTKAY